MNASPALALALAASFALSSCIASNVLDASERQVREGGPELVWRQAAPADFDGLFEAATLEGDVAAAVRAIYYHFTPGGDWSAAALIAGADGLRFQTLAGHFELHDGTLELEAGAAPATARAATDHLRLESTAGLLVLRRVAWR